MGDGVKAALIGAGVTIVIAVASLLGRNTTVIHGHGERINELEKTKTFIVDEFLDASTSRKRLSDRISRMEGALEANKIIAVPTTHTDSRGHR